MQHRIRAAAIVIHDDQILLVKHVHPVTGREWWIPPGGGIEDTDASLFDCAIREAYEEANLKIEVSRLLYIREFHDEENQRLNMELFVLADRFEGEIHTKNITGTGKDEQYIKDVAWISRSNLKDMNVYPEIIKDDLWDDLAAGFLSTKYLGRQSDKAEITN